MDLSTLGEAYFFGQSQSLQERAPFNPDNLFLNLPRYTAKAESRLELRGASNVLDSKLRVRAVADWNDCECNDDRHDDLYATQAYVRWKPSVAASVNLGRQVLTWGPAVFRSPSNPFYFDAGRTQPLRELSGLDVAGLSFNQRSWSVHAVQVFSSGHVGGPEGENFSGSQIGSDEFRGTSLLRIDIQREAFNTGLVAAKRWSTAGFIGGYAAYDLNDAWRLWSEAGWGRRPWSIATVEGSAGYAITAPSSQQATALAGASYTLVNGQSVQLEYLYDGHGLSRSEENAYFDAATVASAALLGPMAAPAAATLAQGLSYAPASLSKHYLAAVWQSSPQDSRFFWRAMWAFNTTDRSHQPSIYAEYSFSKHASWTLSLVFNEGAANSEFGSLLRNSLLAGLKLNLF